MPALKDNLLKYGVLKCRDLVELYYGWRMVTDIIETDNQLDSGVTGPLLQQDPRRIAYDIIMTNYAGTNLEVNFGKTFDLANTAAENYVVGPNSTVVVSKNFLTDLDAVTLPVFINSTGTGFQISTRETFLTPVGVDELPLG